MIRLAAGSAALGVAMVLAGCHGGSRAAPSVTVSLGSPPAAAPVAEAKSRSVPKAIAQTATDGSTAFAVRSASATYDFRLTMKNGCPQTVDLDERCEGPAELGVFRKGSESLVQAIALDNAVIVLGADRELLVNSAELYDNQGTINVGDFNFDGQEDIALQVGHDGPYGAETFAVFLFSAERARFERSEGLSRLTQETLGFFHIDARKKLLVTLSKSGCCYHVMEEHAVVRDKPMRVYRLIEEETPDGYIVETEERLVQGKWRRETRKRPGERAN